MVRSVDTSHGLHPFPTKELALPSRTTHTSRCPPHLVRTPSAATPVAALPEQLAIITEPSGLAGVCRAAPEVAEVWLRARPRLATVLDGCSWGWTWVDAGGRGLHGKGGINVVGLCSAESLRGYGGVYPDIDKVAMQEL